MAFNLGDIFVTFKAKAEGFQAAIDNVKNAGEKVQSVTKKISDFGDGAEKVGKSLTGKLTLPIVAAGGAAIKMSTDFNGAMANIATLIPGNTARVNELKDSIQTMAVQTGKSTNDLANGMYQVVSAFGDTAESAKILEINAKSAKAGLAETTDAINLTSSVTKAYGDTTAAAVQKASDLALMTVRLGQTTFPELAASMGRVTPLAAALNVKQEELFGTMATFTGVTGGAAEVSTQLRGVLQSLMAPTADTQKLMKGLGYSSGEAMIKALGLQGSIDALVAGSKKSGKPLQAFISSIEGQTLALAATGGQADTYTEKIKQMSNVAGVTDAAFNEVTNGVNKAGFSMEQARARMEVAGQKMGDALAPVLVKIADLLSKVADWFIKLDPAAQKVVIVAAAVAAAIGPILIVLGKLAQGVEVAGKAFALLAANPAILLFAAIALVIAGLAYLIYKNWDTLKSWFGTFWNSVTAAAQVAADWFNGIFNTIKDKVVEVFDKVKEKFDAAKGWVEEHKKGLQDIATFIGLVLGPLFIKLAAQAAWTAAQMAVSAIVAGAQWIAQAVVSGAAWTVQFAIMSAQAIAHGVVTGIQAIASGAAWLAQAAIAGGAWLIQFGIMAAGAIATGAVMIAQAIAAGIAWVIALGPVALAIGVVAGLAFLIIKNWDTVKGWFMGLFNWFKVNWPLVLAILTGPFGLAILAIVKNWDTIKGFFSGLVSAIGNIFSRVVDLIVAPYRAAFNMIARLWNGTVGKLSFTAPSWVPGVGGKGFSMPQLPMLAEGGVVSKATLAVIGEGNEPEAVIPLSKIGEVAGKLGVSGQQQGNTFHIHLEGVMARSKSELRDIMMDGIKAVDERLAAQGKPTIIRQS